MILKASVTLRTPTECAVDRLQASGRQASIRREPLEMDQWRGKIRRRPATGYVRSDVTSTVAGVERWLVSRRTESQSSSRCPMSSDCRSCQSEGCNRARVVIQRAVTFPSYIPTASSFTVLAIDCSFVRFRLEVAGVCSIVDVSSPAKSNPKASSFRGDNTPNSTNSERHLLPNLTLRRQRRA